MKIIVIALGGIGDVLMFTPTLKALKKRLPEAKIDALTMFYGSKVVLESTKLCEKVYFVDLYKGSKIKSFSEIMKIKKNKYDISILAFPQYRKEYNFISFIIGARRRIAHRFKTGYFSEFNFLNKDYVEVNEKLHNVENNLNLLNLFGSKGGNKSLGKIKYVFNLDKKYIYFGKEYIRQFKEKVIIGIHPGSTTSTAALMRRWGYNNYLALIKEINKNNKSNVHFLIFGTTEEKKEIEGIMSANITNVSQVKAKSFEEACGILKNCNFLISNENGFAHIATSLEIPLIMLSASTNPKWSGPIGEKVKIIRKANFEPWYRYELKRSIPKGAISGMEDIKVNDVLYGVEKWIKQRFFNRGSGLHSGLHS